MTVRTDRIASAIHRAVQEQIGRGLADPRIRGLVSVTRVSVDDDLSQATVHVSVLPAERGPLALQGLRQARARIRAGLGRSVRMRRVPSLTFRLDESIKKQAEFEAALRQEEEPDR